MNRRFRFRLFSSAAILVIFMLVTNVLSPAAFAAAGRGTAPTFSDVAYGPHESNRLDFWQASSERPTPVIVYIHGGGFREGGKREVRRYGAEEIPRCLDRGVSVASINYRFIEAAPLQDILRDCARAIQFLRHNAAAWNIDKEHIAACGESAGAGTSLWLAFHDDWADPESADPVLRESTRLIAAGAIAPQAGYDFGRWPAIIGIPEMIWHTSVWYLGPVYYHCSGLGAYLRKGAKIRADLDTLSMMDPSDPPVYLLANQEGFDWTWRNLAQWLYCFTQEKMTGKRVPQAISRSVDILHHPAHTQALESACQGLGIPCVAFYSDTPAEQRIGIFDYLLKQVVPDE